MIHIKFEKTDVYGLEHALRGMRNPLESWNRSDSYYDVQLDDYIIGEKDLTLCRKLIKGGSEHRKFLRQIEIWVDITAPLYWWKEFDTYKVGTVANSCSTMHKIAAKEFNIDDFSHDHLLGFTNHNKDERLTPSIELGCGECEFSPYGILELTVGMLNICRERYLTALETEEETGFSAKDIWWQMIQLLPSSYNQKRTISFNYENVYHIYKQRQGHKLTEWKAFCDWAEELPYFKELFNVENNKSKNIDKEMEKCN